MDFLFVMIKKSYYYFSIFVGMKSIAREEFPINNFPFESYPCSNPLFPMKIKRRKKRKFKRRNSIRDKEKQNSIQVHFDYC